ncbi:V-type proton ATPase subunit C-like isoform X2 [Gigantopelta aegis]|uniref:V-type proton ATPase subunit C-like isoform X2 n=1 Tax=Gigantopelta aegis TaxID=1735272 RepID=UPI001B88B8C9|nr:V-type proton ATPase subunit C-like isoform X2 [Gigantopelta aegis]
MSSEFWLISAPGDKTVQQTWDRLNIATSTPERLCNAYKFPIPDLKVGTLDILVGLSDELGKLDIYCESVTRKIAQYLGEVLEDVRDKLRENLKVNDAPPINYVQRFQWDLAKYPIKQSLTIIADIIHKQVNQIESDLKTKSNAFNSLKGNLQSLERKATGSLLTRNLGDIVKKDDFVLDSEYLTTLIIAIPKPIVNDWQLKYEKLTDMVVPRSSKLVKEDNEYALVTVTLFKKVVEEFKHHCRENKFIVRDFQYSEEEIMAGLTEISKLEADKKKQFGPLVKWLKVNFGECFAAWIHVKALRVFVESVLRYGLPVNFQAMLLHPTKRSTKRLREVLNQLYTHLDNTALSGASDTGVDIPGLNMGSTDYYPYVYYRINLDLVDSH